LEQAALGPKRAGEPQQRRRAILRILLGVAAPLSKAGCFGSNQCPLTQGITFGIFVFSFDF
jgi:hypothetical protein